MPAAALGPPTWTSTSWAATVWEQGTWNTAAAGGGTRDDLGDAPQDTWVTAFQMGPMTDSTTLEPHVVTRP